MDISNKFHFMPISLNHRMAPVQSAPKPVSVTLNTLDFEWGLSQRENSLCNFLCVIFLRVKNGPPFDLFWPKGSLCVLPHHMSGLPGLKEVERTTGAHLIKTVPVPMLSLFIDAYMRY